MEGGGRYQASRFYVQQVVQVQSEICYQQVYAIICTLLHVDRALGGRSTSPQQMAVGARVNLAHPAIICAIWHHSDWDHSKGLGLAKGQTRITSWSALLSLVSTSYGTCCKIK